MRVFITGVAGFMGSHLADKLIANGEDVVGVDNLVGGTLDNVAAERHCRKTDGAVCRRQPRLFGASRIGLRSGRRPLLGEIKPLHHPGQFVPYGHQ